MCVIFPYLSTSEFSKHNLKYKKWCPKAYEIFIHNIYIRVSSIFREAARESSYINFWHVKIDIKKSFTDGILRDINPLFTWKSIWLVYLWQMASVPQLS